MKLSAYLGTDNKEKMKFAAALGISYATLCNWLSGRFSPNVKNLQEIEKLTNGKVKAKDFYE